MQQIQHTKKDPTRNHPLPNFHISWTGSWNLTPSSSGLAASKNVFFMPLLWNLRGPDVMAQKKSDNLPPTTVSSFTDEDAFELEDAFNEEVMLHKSSHREREYKKHSKTESHHLGIHRHCFGLRLLRWIDLQNKDKHCLFMRLCF